MFPCLFTVLVITAKIWKQPKYPSTDKWIRGICNTYSETHMHRKEGKKRRKVCHFDNRDGENHAR